MAAVGCQKKATKVANRGVALIVVLTAVAILSAFSTEFAYRSRVEIRIASNLEREVQAYFHARSAMEIARLVITSQKMVDQVVSALGGAIPGLGRGRFELWRFACKFAEIFSSAQLDFMGLPLLNLKGTEGVGVDQGGFYCEITPEDSRINLNASATVADRRMLFSKLYPLLRLEHEDVGPNELDREAVELILNIMDWTDPDNERTDIDENGNIVQTGGADEGGIYSKYDYEPRNAKMDTVAEVRLVEGMTDEIYCKYKGQFTVYNTTQINVNEASLPMLKAILCDNLLGQDPYVVCGVPGQPMPPPMDMALGLLEMCRNIKRALFTPPFSSVNDFLGFFNRLPDPIREFVRLNPSTLRPILGTSSRVLRVKARGYVKDTGYQIEAVIDTSSMNYVYWHESGYPVEPDRRTRTQQEDIATEVQEQQWGAE